jgi:hypothetical protein
MAKLTLHVPEDLVLKVKKEAAARQVSVSKLVTDFFRSLDSHKSSSDSKKGREPDLAPRTERLSGCLSSGKLVEYEDYLKEKYS